jgi:hypothetical protein
MSEMHERLEELLFASSGEPFSEAERAELNALLRDNAEARSFAAAHLTIDALLAESLAASEHTTAFRPIPISAGKSLNRPNWLARAAAWIGAFHLFSNTAKATTTTILMKKTVTSITAAILVLGGSGIYVIHHTNESSRARVTNMETEIQSLSDQLGIKSTRSTQGKAGAGNSRKQVSVTQVSAILSDSVISSHELAQFEAFKEQLAAMEAEALKNLLLDAEKISNPIQGRVAEMIMHALISKDPAVATQIASQLIGRGSEFQFLLSSAATKAFGAWLTKDPTAANAWYLETAAAGGFIGKNIPPNGLEDNAIDRSFARLRFASLVGTNPSEAATMLATMLPGDVTTALQSVTDPNALRQIFPKLSPEQKSPAAEGAIKAMAAKDLDAAFAWAKSLGMEDRDRDSLLATGIEAAVENRKLDLPEVAERSRNLNLDAKRRSELLVSAATNVSLIPRKNPHRLEPDNSVYWDRVPERIDWLRKEAPSGSADKMVGDYLGDLSYASFNLKKSLETYDNEVSRQGRIDPDLTIAFAFDLGLSQDDSASAAALKLLNKLPPSEKRDHAIRSIEMNR